MSQRKTATLDDDALFSTTPAPVPGIPQRSLKAPARTPEKTYDLNFKVTAETRRRVKTLAYTLDIKQVEVLQRALDALEREIAK